MYVKGDLACAVPNSATPVTRAQILAGVQKREGMEQIIRRAQLIFDRASVRPDMAPVKGTFQTSRAMTFARYPSVSKPGSSSAAATTEQSCATSAEIQTEALTSAPAPAPMPSLTTKPLEHKTIPTTGNVCKDLKLGWVLPEQVTAEQLFECASKGYAGVLAPPEAIVALQNAVRAAAGLPKVPFQSVESAGNWDAQAEENAMIERYRAGMAGGMGTSFSFPWALAGFGAAGLWLLFEWANHGRRAR